MKTRYVWVCLAWTLITILLVEGQQPMEEEEEEEDDDLIPYNGQRFDQFDWDLCGVLDDEQPGNVIASTLSVKLLLSMIYQGTGGTTMKELERVLQLPPGKAASAAKASSIIQSLKGSPGLYEVQLASKIYLDRSLQAKYWYQRNLRKYEVFIESDINFSDSERAAKRINGWVNLITRGKIETIIDDPHALTDTIMLLVNAVYFKGMWSYPFPVENTFKGKFKSPRGLHAVDYMRQERYFYYTWSADLASQVIRLPYKGKKLAMYIVLPDKEDGLELVQANLKPHILWRTIWELEQVVVELILPKFKIEFTADMKELLKKIGITSIFEPNNADFIGIKKSTRAMPVVTEVIHKAMIEIDEKGTVAAATTAIEIGNKFGGNEISFNASHPFLFFIEDEKTGTVVFLGKFVNPEESVVQLTEDDGSQHQQQQQEHQQFNNEQQPSDYQQPNNNQQSTEYKQPSSNQQKAEEYERVQQQLHQATLPDPVVKIPAQHHSQVHQRVDFEKPLVTPSPPLIKPR